MGKHDVKRGRRASGANSGPKGDLVGSMGDARSRRDRIKDAQLCSEVREVLSLVLAQSSDERVQSVFVMDVIPAPDSSRLAVRVEVPKGIDAAEIHEVLNDLVGELRSEIAGAVNRKRTPSLTFVVGYGGAPPE